MRGPRFEPEIIIFVFTCHFLTRSSYRMEGWMEGGKDGWMHGWMDGWMD